MKKFLVTLALSFTPLMAADKVGVWHTLWASPQITLDYEILSSSRICGKVWKDWPTDTNTVRYVAETSPSSHTIGIFTTIEGAKKAVEDDCAIQEQLKNGLKK